MHCNFWDVAIYVKGLQWAMLYFLLIDLISSTLRNFDRARHIAFLSTWAVLLPVRTQWYPASSKHPETVETFLEIVPSAPARKGRNIEMFGLFLRFARSGFSTSVISSTPPLRFSYPKLLQCLSRPFMATLEHAYNIKKLFLLIRVLKLQLALPLFEISTLSLVIVLTKILKYTLQSTETVISIRKHILFLVFDYDVSASSFDSYICVHCKIP